MKKGKNAKDKREKANAEKMRAVKENDRIRKEQEAKLAEERRIAEEKRAAEEAVKARKKAIAAIEKEDESLKKIKKSNAKAAGMKSAFVIDDETVLVTSFGKGSKAVREKYVTGKAVKNISEDAAVEIVPSDDEREYKVSGRIVNDATRDNPIHSAKKPGDDIVHLRSKLEKMYFGKNFEDNIHIQLIYRILDIEKILAEHVNNVVFSVDNMLRDDKPEYNDFIGYIGLDSSYGKFMSNDLYDTFRKLLHKPQLGYFGDILLPPTDGGGKRVKVGSDKWNKYEEESYYILALLGTLRQATAHGRESARSMIYTLGEEFDKVYGKGEKQGQSETARKDARKVLDKMYSSRVKGINKEFLDNSGNDLVVLFNSLGIAAAEEKNALVKDYYDFVVTKKYKNTGYSIKLLRETMLDNYAAYLKTDEYSTVRHKLYRMIDFVIYRYMKNETAMTERLVETLRSSVKESEKIYAYNNCADMVWKAVESQVASISRHISEKNAYANGKKSANVSDAVLDDVCIPASADTFSEVIYLMTEFMDGKEINNLLTGLIKCFDDIASFIDVLKEENMYSDDMFSKNYRMFNRSREISEELRVINSFARMSKPSPAAKKIMFIEAAEILGYEDNEEELELFIDGMLDKESAYYKKHKTNFRNFIANNVIESSRFKYIIRYGNPKKVRALIENRAVVDFVLKEIPDAQILSYYISCNGYEKGSMEFKDDMREYLAEEITGLSFMDFEDVYQGNDGTPEEAADKERKKNIVGLYLTVLYLALKNLVNINSRYYMAFHIAERDAMIAGYKQKDVEANRAAFARAFVEEEYINKPRKKRVKGYLGDNFDKADNWSHRTFRNYTEHLNVIRNVDMYIDGIREVDSYFALYHYLMQKGIELQYRRDIEKDSDDYPGTKIYDVNDPENNQEALERYFGLVDKYRTYCKDFVKELNLPFAYNLARYKNLSIKELFDRNDYKPNENGKHIED